MRMYNPEWEAIRDFENLSNIRDASFDLCAGEIPADHGVTLFEALLRHLPWLAELLGLSLPPHWPEARQRRWLREAGRAQQLKGTLAGALTAAKASTIETLKSQAIPVKE